MTILSAEHFLKSSGNCLCCKHCVSMETDWLEHFLLKVGSTCQTWQFWTSAAIVVGMHWLVRTALWFVIIHCSYEVISFMLTLSIHLSPSLPSINTGTLPTELGYLTSMTRLGINMMNMTGTIPSQLGAMTGMKKLFLHNTHLSGLIPRELTGMTDLEAFTVSNTSSVGCLDTQLVGRHVPKHGGNSWASSEKTKPRNEHSAPGRHWALGSDLFGWQHFSVRFWPETGQARMHTTNFYYCIIPHFSAKRTVQWTMKRSEWPTTYSATMNGMASTNLRTSSVAFKEGSSGIEPNGGSILETSTSLAPVERSKDPLVTSVIKMSSHAGNRPTPVPARPSLYFCTVTIV